MKTEKKFVPWTIPVRGDAVFKEVFSHRWTGASGV
jgi:hypothetical protein